MKKLALWALSMCLLLSTPLGARASQAGGLSGLFEGPGNAAAPTETPRSDSANNAGGLSDVFEGRQASTAAPVMTPGANSAGGLSGVFEGSRVIAAPPPEPQPSAPPVPAANAHALFDDGVREIVPRAIGNAADYLDIGGWIVGNGFLPSGDFALIGYPTYGGAPRELCPQPQIDMIPAGDAIIYLRKFGDDDAKWVIHKPGEEPEKLPLSVMDSVFYADESRIWYSTIGTGDGTQMSIRTLDRRTGQKEGLARFSSIQVFPVTVLDSGGVVLYDRENNRVEHWQDGKTTTLLETDESIVSVFSTGQCVWVELEHEIGLLEDGKLWFRIPGNVAQSFRAAGQTVLLLIFPGSDEYDVLVLNDAYRAYARLGYAPVAESAWIEPDGEGRIVVHAPMDAKGLPFDIFPASEWIPYGFYDAESARAAKGAHTTPAPTPTPNLADVLSTQEVNRDEMITITVDAALVAWLSEEDARDEAHALGIYFADNRDGSFTYGMMPDQQRTMLDMHRNDLNGAIAEIPSMFPGIQSCKTDADFTELTFFVTSELDQNVLIMVSTITGSSMAMYRALSGEESPFTLVKVIDADSGAVVSTLRVPSEQQ